MNISTPIRTITLDRDEILIAIEDFVKSRSGIVIDPRTVKFKSGDTWEVEICEVEEEAI